jgi:hypothetical protein
LEKNPRKDACDQKHALHGGKVGRGSALSISGEKMLVAISEHSRNQIFNSWNLGKLSRLGEIEQARRVQDKILRGPGGRRFVVASFCDKWETTSGKRRSGNDEAFPSKFSARKKSVLQPKLGLSRKTGVPKWPRQKISGLADGWNPAYAEGLCR